MNFDLDKFVKAYVALSAESAVVDKPEITIHIHNPESQPSAESLQENLDNQPTLKDLSSAFQVIKDDEDKIVGWIDKTDDGKFASYDSDGVKLGNISKSISTAVDKVKSGKVTTPETYAYKKKQLPEESKYGENSDFIQIMNDTDIQIGYIHKDSTGKFTSFNKNNEQIGNPVASISTAVAKVHVKANEDQESI